MKATGIIGAVIGGLAGALIWGAIAKFLQIELGYVAWGVGLAVGFLSYAFGGRGIANGVLCAIVALLAIYGGKVLAIMWSATPDTMMQYMGQDSEYKDIPEADKKQIAESAAGAITWKTAAEGAVEDLDILDIIFALLGIGTAFKIGASPKEGDVVSSGGPIAPPPGAEPGAPVPPMTPHPPPTVVPMPPVVVDDPDEPNTPKDAGT